MTSKVPNKSQLSSSSAAAWMERLRAKASTYRSAQDLCRATRTTLLDRRQAPDAADRVQLRASLEQLANAVPARDATSLADRLEAISKQVAARWTKRGVATLNFMAAPVHGCYYLSTDCFYVEINIEGSSGRVAEAKVHHIDSNHPNQQTSASKNCPEIIQCLTKGEFQRFIDHLEGLMAIYDIPNASAQDKTRGWNALALCEDDLARLDFEISASQDVGAQINLGALGFLQPRAGGLPLKMTYFVAPMDKLDVNTKNLRKLNGQIINDEHIGVYATVGIEKCETPRHLPLGPLISENGAEIPLNQNNSIQLPAGFVLHLGDFLALESSKYHEIVNITGISFVQDVKPLPLFQLITKSFSDDHLDSSNNRGMFVTLPDQSHCYFLSDHKSMSGYKIKKIPFSHPGQVPRILAILRQQAVFNSVISSCIRSSGIQDLEKSHLLEVSCMDLSRLCVTFEMSQGMATFELDFTDFQNVQCKLHKLSSNDLGLNTLMTKQVFEKTLSLPLTMRSLIKQALKKSRPLDPDPDPQVMYNNGNLDNGQVVPMDLDFPGRSLKVPMVEPMDYESPSLSRKDHLNANRPQDAALNPGVRAQPIKGLTPTTKTTATANTTKFSRINQVEIKALKSKPANLALQPFEQTKQAKKMGDPIKPSVSITPVSSADVIDSVKKPVGIEIIPLGDKLPSDKMPSDKSKYKEIKRSLSEDDKRRLERKKKKRDHFSLKNEDGSSKKSSGSSSSSKSSSSSSSSSNKKLTSVIDRLSSGHNDSGIEIVPASKYEKKEEKSKASSLKLTIKSTSSSSTSSSTSSSNKHRSSSDYHHKSSSKPLSSSGSSSSHSSSKHSSSSHSSSSSSAKRSSPNMSQMVKHSKSPQSSSSSSSSGSKDKYQKDKDRIEEVKRLISGNKLDTTFQIPKKRDSASEKSSSNSKSANASPKYTTSPSPKYGSNSTSSSPKQKSSPPHLVAFDKAAPGCDKDNFTSMNNSK